MADRLQIFATSIDEMTHFKKYGDEFTFVKKNSAMNTYMYKRVNIDTGAVYYEVVIPKKTRNPDGSIVYTYPSAEMFGLGHAMCTSSLERAEEYLNNGCSRI